MEVKKLNVREAKRILKKLGLGYGGDGTTYYAATADESEIYTFDSKTERDRFIEKALNGKG